MDREDVKKLINDLQTKQFICSDKYIKANEYVIIPKRVFDGLGLERKILNGKF